MSLRLSRTSKVALIWINGLESSAPALLWQIHSRCCSLQIDLRQCGHNVAAMVERRARGWRGAQRAKLAEAAARSFIFSAALLLGGDAGGGRKRSLSSAHGGGGLARIDLRSRQAKASKNWMPLTTSGCRGSGPLTKINAQSVILTAESTKAIDPSETARLVWRPPTCARADHEYPPGALAV